MTSLLEIAIPCPLRQSFHYLSNDEVKSWQQGERVLVPFSGRTLIGIVIAAEPYQQQDNKYKLKQIAERFDKSSLIPQDIFNLICWASQYYHHPIGECFQVALPKNVMTAKQNELLTEIGWQRTDKKETVTGNKQNQVLSLFSNQQQKLAQSFIYESLGQCRTTLLSLEKKGLIKQLTEIKKPQPLNNIEPTAKLNHDQQAIVDKVNQAHEQFSPFLLHGITGSGKTEVYIHLAKHCLALKQQVLILIPEIGLTEQFVSRFKRHLAATIVEFNSAMSDRERQQAWLLAKDGLADIIIGTRSAVFTPTTNLGLIIIDEEHDNSFKQQESMRYHARNIALLRAKNSAIPIVLGSATPSMESLYQAEQGNYQYLELTKRATGANLPTVHIVDSHGPYAQKGLSSELYQAISKELAKDNQVLIFINRRGYAPILMCHDCGWQASCPQCDAKMVVHKQRYQLRCHHCGYVQSLIRQCPDCQSEDLNVYGLGTEQVEQTLQQLFPESNILRIDRDTTQRVGAFASIVNEVKQGGAKILVGTQMLAKGHDFHDVTLVGVLDADQGLYSADFRAKEVLAQLITQVTGRAGRGNKAGKVLIQSKQKDDPFWQDIIDKGYKATAEKLLQQRIDASMPPVGSLCVIRSRAKDSTHAMTFLSELAQQLHRTTQQTVLILGPVPAVMEKKAGYYRAQLLLTTQNRKALHQLLDQAMAQITALKIINKVHWSIDIDPIDLL